MGTVVEPIRVFNRYTGRVEVEPVYGERWLRWTYETTAGRISLGLAVNKLWFSRLYGWRMSSRRSRRRVAPFIEKYGVNEDEFAQPAGSFASFNDFFSRRLKFSARPICGGPGSVVFPADGRHLAFQDIGGTDRYYAKGQWLKLAELLGDAGLARRYEHGSLVISRLCPVDYHRFHFPCPGQTGEPRLIGGVLYSVSPIALRGNLDYLVRNKRVVTEMENTGCGRVVLVEIGATCVGTIVQTAAVGSVNKGQEKGYFRFGGSCVMTLFEPQRVRLSADLIRHSQEGREVYARMGDSMGAVA